MIASRDRGHSNNGSVNMINNRVPTVFAVLVVVGALAAPANAAEVHEVPAVATPGNAAEAAVVLGAKLLVCNTCHGADGLPRQANTPVIWGQQEGYLLKQMHDFQSGDRDNEVMSWMATALTQSGVGVRGGFFREKGLAGAGRARRRSVAARRSGRMPGLSSAELRRRPGGAAAGRPKLRISGRGDAPLCRRRAEKQYRHDANHEGDFARRPGGDGALHIRLMIGNESVIRV